MIDLSEKQNIKKYEEMTEEEKIEIIENLKKDLEKTINILTGNTNKTLKELCEKTKNAISENLKFYSYKPDLSYDYEEINKITQITQIANNIERNKK